MSPRRGRAALLSRDVDAAFLHGSGDSTARQTSFGGFDGLAWLTRDPQIPLLEPDPAVRWAWDAEPRPFPLYDFETARAHNAYRDGLPGGIRPPQPQPVESVAAPYEDGGWFDRRWQDVEDLAAQGYDAVTGDDRREFDYPSATYLPVDDLWQQLGWSGAQMVTMTDTGLADIIHARYPDALWGEDSFGNTIVVVDDQPYYLNRPGIDAVDITRFVPSTLLRGRMMAGAINWGGTTPTEVGLKALGAAGADLWTADVLDILSRGFGSEVPVGSVQFDPEESFLKNLLKMSWRNLFRF